MNLRPSQIPGFFAVVGLSERSGRDQQQTAAVNIIGTVVGDQKICKNYKIIIRYTSGKFFEKTNNGRKSAN